MTLESARAALTLAQSAGNAARTWDAAAKALGNEPPVDSAPKAPAPPPGERPTLDARNMAAATLANAERAKGAAERHAAQVDRAGREVVVAETAAEDGAAAVAHAEALVEACRAAPGKMLAGMIAALGDTGPVSLDFTDTGVTVLVNGRPWDAPLAVSSGELVAADLAFRGALRRVAKLGWAHLWADDRQDWSGALPDVGGRVVALRTATGALRVVDGAS